LETLARVAAPLAPLITEEVWRGITGGESVHLTNWPNPADFPHDGALVAAMDSVREVASAGLALRKAHGARVRLPLSRLSIVTRGAQALEPYAEILSEELNVKSVECVELDDSVESRWGIGKKLIPNARALGPRLGKQVQTIIAGAKAGDWSVENGVVTVSQVELLEGEYELELTAENSDTAVQFLASGGFVLLDTTVTPELASEGLARDVVRWIQQERKNAGLEVSDRIRITLGANEIAAQAIATHQDLIAKETLAMEISVVAIASGSAELSVGDGSTITVEVAKHGS
jgi:isoleucyl-tRNA synthetase